MAAICPNMNDPQVAREFNELKEAIGETAAYNVWSRNNGNGIDKAPNGEPSILFNTLLILTGGNRKLAIRLKSDIFTNRFLSWFGNWLDRMSENVSKIVDKNGEPQLVFHGTNSDYSRGFRSAKREKGSGAPETKNRNDFYFNVQPFASLQYIDGVNRNGRDVNGFGTWNKLWWELKEIMSNGRRENNDWKDIVISEETIRQAIPNKKGVFNRDSGGTNGKWLSERKADYGYENKTDKEFFEEVFGIRFGEDTFNTWVERNRKIFEDIYSANPQTKGLYGAFVVIKNPIIEHDQNTYYEEERSLMTTAEQNGNDGIISYSADNEFNSDVIIPLNIGKTDKERQQRIMWVNYFQQEVQRNDNIFVNQNSPFEVISEIDAFGSEITSKLLNGEVVSSRELLTASNNDHMMYLGNNLQLAKVLSKHDIPIRLSSNLNYGVVATTITDENGGSAIVINRDWMHKVSKSYFGTSLLHEVVHAITANALVNPVTTEQVEFKHRTERIFNTLQKLAKKDIFNLINTESGLYALSKIQEFASVFITDETARNNFYALAKQSDKTTIARLKNFINSIVRLFVNKNLFTSNTEQLQQYENYMRSYLSGVDAIEHGNILNSSKLKLAYTSISDDLIKNESIVDRLLDISRFSEAWQQNNIEIELSIANKAIYVQKSQAGDSYTNMKNALQSGILAIRASRLEEHTKQTLVASLQSQLDSLNNESVTKYQALSNIIRLMGPRIINAFDEIKAIKEDPDITGANSNYQYYCHDNIGMYDTLIKCLGQLFQNDLECSKLISAHNEYDKQNPIDETYIQDMKNMIYELSGKLSEAHGLLKTILDQSAVNSLKNIMVEAGAKEDLEHLYKLDSDTPVIDSDINWFSLYFGQADASSNDAIRALAHKLTQVDTKVDNLFWKRGSILLELQSKLKKGESVLDIFEFVDGKATQNIVRDLNFGKFEKEYKQFMKKLNSDFGLAEDNVVSPINLKDRIAWNNARNNWLYEHCERKYNKKYYDAWAKISSETKAAIDGINGSINAILEQYDVVDEKGYFHYEKITDDKDYETLQRLWVAKRLLRSTKDEFGNDKSGIDLQIANELNQLYKDLYGDEYKEREKNIERWKKARNEIIESCGGQEEYDKYLQEKPNNFDFNKLDSWDARNSKYVMKKNKEGKALVFDLIEQAVQGMQIDYGEEYNDLKQQAKDLLNPYYDLSGEVNAEFLPEAIKGLLNNVIYKRMAEIRKQVVSTHPGYEKIQQRYKQAFDEYIKLVDTRYYKKIKNSIIDSMVEEFDTFDFELYEISLGAYGNAYEQEGMIMVQPYKWLQKLEAKDEEFMEWVPNNGWSEQTEDDALLNENFDYSYNTTMVPKRSKYDNSEAFNKVKNSETLYAYYKEALAILKESNALQTNRNWTNDYKLPGITANLYERMKRAPFFRKINKWYDIFRVFGKLDTLMLWGLSKIGFRGTMPTDQQLQDRTTIDDDQTEEGDEINANPIFTRVIGTHADGSTYNALPQYYTRRLQNPEDISYDLTNMLLSYYKMSLNYSEKLKIRDECETIVDWLKNRSFSKDLIEDNFSRISNSTKNVFKKNKKQYHELRGSNYSEASNVYKSARNLLDMSLYNKTRSELRIGWFQLSATFSTLRQYTTATNLGWNKKVAMVGYLTAMNAHLLNSICGKEYTIPILIKSGWEVARQIVRRTFTEGYSNKSSNKNQLILEQMGIASQLERKIEDANRSQLMRLIMQNHTFGYLSTIDYLSKSQITTACLMDYKLIGDKFYSRLDILYMRHDKQKFREMADKYKKAKSAYELLETKTITNEKGQKYNTLVMKNQEAQAAWDRDFNRIKSKCVKMSEKADGVATGVQRAAIQQTWYGMFIMIHRQFLPLMLNERWGNRVYDYDTEEYKYGQFKIMWKYLKELAYNTWFTGATAWALTGSAFLGPYWGTILGLTAFGGMKAYGSFKGNSNKKSLKQVNRDMFGTKASNVLFKDPMKWNLEGEHTQMEAINKLENSFAFRQVMWELTLYSLFDIFVVQPICAWADDDKDDIILQMIAYWLKATQFETHAPYNTSDIISTIKSPTASTSILDKVQYFGQSTVDYAIAESLLNLSLTEDKPKPIGKNSIYEGWSKPAKGAFQLFLPFHNEWEQSTARGNKQKRNYMERQILHEQSGYNKNIYKGELPSF